MNSALLASAAPARRRLVALLCLFAVCGALLALLGWSRGWLRERVDFVTVLADNAGVSKSSAVVLNGLTVGRVRAARLVERAGALRVEVRFWVAADEARWLRPGSRVLVRGDVLNAARLELLPALGPGGPLAAGTELPGAIAPDIVGQLLELQPAIKNLIAEVGRMIAGINDRAARFDPLIAKIDTQLDAIGGHVAGAVKIVEDARALLTQVKTDEAAVAAKLGEALHRLNAELLPELTGLVRGNRADLAESLRSLNRTLGEVERQLPAILRLSEETLKNSRDFSEAAAHTWPFSRYVQKKEAEAAKAGKPAPSR